MLSVEKPGSIFNTEEIKRGTLIYAKHRSWTQPLLGMVTSVTEDKAIVQYLPDIGNVTNHFFLCVAEVENLEWELRYTNDMLHILRYPMEEENESEGTDIQET